MPRRGVNLVLVAMTGAIAGCAGAPREVVLPPVAALGSAVTVDPVFGASPRIMSGFELAPTPEDWQIGDEVLLGIRVTKPGKDTVQFLKIELMDKFNPLPVASFKATPSGRAEYKFESGLYYTRLSVYDGEAKLLNTAVGRFPEKLMGHGLYDGAEPAIGRKRNEAGEMDLSGISDEQSERELLGWLSLFSFSMSMNKKGMFNEMLREVVARPSLLAMLFNPSISLGMGKEGEIQRQAWTAPGAETVDAVTLPLTCAIADKMGAVARVHAVRPVAPLGLSGGVVSIVGNNADKPDVTFEVRVLAAKRGTKGRAFLPALEDPEP